MIRRPTRLERGVLAVTALLAAVTVAWASLPPRPLRSVLTAIHAVSLSVAVYWLVVVGLLAVADRLAGSERVTRRSIVRLAAVVFVGALAIEASPLARLVVDPTAVGTATLFERAVGAVRTALYPTGLFVGTALAALALRDATGERPPFATDDGFGHPAAPAALWRMGRVLVGFGGVYAALGALSTLAVAPDPYLLLTVVEATVDALYGLADHLVVGAALVALLTYGVTVRSLLAAGTAVLTGAFLLGIGVGILAALLGVTVVSVTVTPIPAVESAALVDWPDPLSWDSLVLVGTVVAAGIGFRTLHGRFVPRRPETTGPAANDRSNDGSNA